MERVDLEFPESEIRLRDVTEGDLPIFFEDQRDPLAIRMAAFPARDRAAFMAHWQRILSDRDVITRTIECGDRVAGNVVCWEQSGRRLVGYWLGRRFWGRGIATRALSEFLKQVRARPLHALVAVDNAGSIRVLEKCGFLFSETDTAPASAAEDGVDELVFTLTD